MPPEVEALCKKRRETRVKMLSNPNDDEIRKIYEQLNKDVKKK